MCDMHGFNIYQLRNGYIYINNIDKYVIKEDTQSGKDPKIERFFNWLF